MFGSPVRQGVKQASPKTPKTPLIRDASLRRHGPRTFNGKENDFGDDLGFLPGSPIVNKSPKQQETARQSAIKQSRLRLAKFSEILSVAKAECEEHSTIQQKRSFKIKQPFVVRLFDDSSDSDSDSDEAIAAAKNKKKTTAHRIHTPRAPLTRTPLRRPPTRAWDGEFSQAMALVGGTKKVTSTPRVIRVGGSNDEAAAATEQQSKRPRYLNQDDVMETIDAGEGVRHKSMQHVPVTVRDSVSIAVTPIKPEAVENNIIQAPTPFRSKQPQPQPQRLVRHVVSTKAVPASPKVVHPAGNMSTVESLESFVDDIDDMPELRKRKSPSLHSSRVELEQQLSSQMDIDQENRYNGDDDDDIETCDEEELEDPAFDTAFVPPDLETMSAAAISLIHRAAAMGDNAKVEELLAGGANINTCDQELRTPLMYAVQFRKPDTAKLLIARGCSVNAQSEDGSTALHRASFCGSPLLVGMLIQGGANPFLEDMEQRIPLHWCTKNSNRRCLSILIKQVEGVDINVTDNAGMTPLMWGCYYDNGPVVSKLLRNGAASSICDIEGKAATHWAVQAKGTSALKAVVTRQSVAWRDSHKKTVLHLAAEAGNKRAIRYILSLDSSIIDNADAHNRTALHWAAVMGHAKAAACLMKRGASVNVTDDCGNVPLFYAQQKGHMDCIEVLQTDVPSIYSQTDQQCLSSVAQESNTEPSEAVTHILRMLTVGSYLGKYTNGGKGSKHMRYFWVDYNTGELCWTKSPSDFTKDPSLSSSTCILDVRGTPSSPVRSRKNYDPSNKHKYAFTVIGSGRQLDLVADSEETYKLWVHGIRCLLTFGHSMIVSHQA